MIDAARLAAAGVPDAFIAPMLPALEHHFICTPGRAAAFIAQCRVESFDFAHLVEDLHYSHADRIVAVFHREVPTLAAAYPLVERPEALANAVYANRMGNGDAASGDGWAFRGRGLAQLTGRANYAAAAEALGRPYVDEPDLVAQPADAVLVAAWYWQVHGCNALADVCAWDAITRVWNGPAMEQAPRRAALSVSLQQALS